MRSEQLISITIHGQCGQNISLVIQYIEMPVSLSFDLSGVLKMSTFIKRGYQVWCLVIKQFSYVDVIVRSLYNVC